MYFDPGARRLLLWEEYCAANPDGFCYTWFCLLRHGKANERATLNALHSDLAIVGDPQPGGLSREWSAEALLLATGVPFLLLPGSWTGPAAEHVIVAWNASREARRAIAVALPLLVGALSVTILMVMARNPAPTWLCIYLSRHGSNVVVEQVQSNGEPVADVILLPSFSTILGDAHTCNIQALQLSAFHHGDEVRLALPHWRSSHHIRFAETVGCPSVALVIDRLAHDASAILRLAAGFAFSLSIRALTARMISDDIVRPRCLRRSLNHLRTSGGKVTSMRGWAMMDALFPGV